MFADRPRDRSRSRRGTEMQPPEPGRMEEEEFQMEDAPPEPPITIFKKFRYQRLGMLHEPSAELLLVDNNRVVYTGTRPGERPTRPHGQYEWSWHEIPHRWNPWWLIPNSLPTTPGKIWEPHLTVNFHCAGVQSAVRSHMFIPKEHPVGSWIFLARRPRDNEVDMEWSVIMYEN